MPVLRTLYGRFERRRENNGTWTVFDSTTGRPAEVGSRQTTGMQIGDAEEMLSILNRIRPAAVAGTIHKDIGCGHAHGR